MSESNRKKPSITARMVALAVACVSGTLLFSWATAPHVWWSLACLILLLVSATFLAICRDE